MTTIYYTRIDAEGKFITVKTFASDKGNSASDAIRHAIDLAELLAPHIKVEIYSYTIENGQQTSPDTLLLKTFGKSEY